MNCSATVEHELELQSPHSPGLVEEGEMLLRLGFSPEHIVDGEVIPNAIPSEDLKCRGFSVYRKQYLEYRHIQELAEQQGNRLESRRQQSQDPFISVFQCACVRAIIFDKVCQEVEGKRAAVVVDEAEIDNIAHATIYSTSQRPRDIKWLKNRLQPILNNLISLEAYFKENNN